mmetsp:Transcript_8572/g.24387  ORF Transcript_8572/g.24387 Transcript_8572/m.24387 type:complete len:229 (+) Transcript_8572:1627-2313(+)
MRSVQRSRDRRRPPPPPAPSRAANLTCTLPSRRSRSTPSLRARVFTRSATSCVSTTVGSVRAPRDTPARSESSMFATCPRARPQTRASWRRPSTRSVPRSCRRTRARWPKWFSTFAWAMCCVYDPRIRTSTCSASRHPLRRSRASSTQLRGPRLCASSLASTSKSARPSPTRTSARSPPRRARSSRQRRTPTSIFVMLSTRRSSSRARAATVGSSASSGTRNGSRPFL